MDPQSAGSGMTLTVSTKSGRTEVLTNIAFGDVVLCSGQSNMVRTQRTCIWFFLTKPFLWRHKRKQLAQQLAPLIVHLFLWYGSSILPAISSFVYLL
eukprot:SAG11_NODE_11683_length_744_cov_1.310078_2_plen_97_part_01